MGRAARSVAAAVALLAAATLTGCVTSTGTPDRGASSPGQAAPAPATAQPHSAAAPGALTLLTEPDQGVQPIYALISSARRSIDLTMYELVDDTAEADLIAAVHRGVDVRVILDTNRERQEDVPAYDRLRAGGVRVVWADTRYAATHEKSMVIDNQLALVMTLNLTSRYYDSTRDFAVLDRDQSDVAAIEAVFVADFAHQTVAARPADDLIWSPGASEPALADLIASARTSLVVENEEMASKPITKALVAAAERKVSVTVVMTDQADWHSAFATLAKAGVRISVYAPTASLYIHAKVVVVDAGSAGARAFVGSENFSAASLDHNRELGVITADPALIRALTSTLASDAAGGSRWTP